jgi:transcriptional regulator with XRE-family HTH domain
MADENSGEATVHAPDSTLQQAKGGAIVDRLWAYGRRVGFHRQRDLAQHLGITEETIRKWKNNISEPSRSLLERVASRTPMRLEWLVTGEGPMLAPQAAVAGQMRAGDALVIAAPAPEPVRLSGRLDLDRLVRAYRAAIEATRGLDDRERMRFTLLIYDKLSETAETQEKPASQGSHPQDHPRNDPQAAVPAVQIKD